MDKLPMYGMKASYKQPTPIAVIHTSIELATQM